MLKISTRYRLTSNNFSSPIPVITLLAHIAKLFLTNLLKSFRKFWAGFKCPFHTGEIWCSTPPLALCTNKVHSAYLYFLNGSQVSIVFLFPPSPLPHCHITTHCLTSATFHPRGGRISPSSQQVVPVCSVYSDPSVCMNM